MALIKKRFWELEKKNVFQNPLYFEKSNLALVGPNLHSRTILQKQISFICMKAPRTERVAQISKKRPLSPNPTIGPNVVRQSVYPVQIGVRLRRT